MSVTTPSAYQFARHPQTMIAVLIAIALVCAAPNSAQSSDLVVRYDQSQLLRMPKPVNQIIIGNPSIADVVLQSDTLLVVTGKTFGMTNIIALDQQGNVIQDQRVVVQREGSRTVNLINGTRRQSLTCTPRCTPTITIGDDSNYFDTVAKHAETKTKFSATGEAGASQANSNQ